MIKIETVQNPAPEDYKQLIEGVRQHAKDAKGVQPAEHWASFAKTPEGKIVGGVGGYFYLGCMSIEKLWVSPDCRGQGLGVSLLETMEAMGVKRKCRFVTLCTNDWEALGLYQKNGYKLEFERRGYDLDSVFYYLIKDLNTSH